MYYIGICDDIEYTRNEIRELCEALNMNIGHILKDKIINIPGGKNERLVFKNK